MVRREAVLYMTGKEIPMKVLDSKFVKDFIKMADDGYHEGWHERNGGNLSYRIRPEEVETIRSRLSDRGEWTPIGVSVPDLAGEFFLVTGTGKYFRNIIVDPEACITIIEIDEKGCLLYTSPSPRDTR